MYVTKEAFGCVQYFADGVNKGSSITFCKKCACSTSRLSATTRKRGAAGRDLVFINRRKRLAVPHRVASQLARQCDIIIVNQALAGWCLSLKPSRRKRGQRRRGEGGREESGQRAPDTHLSLANIIFVPRNNLSLTPSVVIESVDSISRDERDVPLTQYVKNAGISRARYTITHFKHHYRVYI